MGPWESMPWFGIFFAPIMMIAVLATVVIVVVLVVRWLGGGFSPGNVPSLPPPHSRHKTALEILEERFAKGEIENDEFEEKKRICDSP